MKRTILLVSFGTSDHEARENSINRIFEDMKQVVSNGEVVQAYTSGMILKKLERQGIDILSIENAMKEIMQIGSDELYVVPTHIIPGIEYHKIIQEIEKYKKYIKKIVITTPILNQEEDCDFIVSVLEKIIDFKEENEYILMGHGTETTANIRYEQMNVAFQKAGYQNVRIASVEAKPDLEDAMEELRGIREKKKIKKVIVQPFMVVAGDHAKNDMAGDEDSYRTKLLEAGYEVEAVVKGLGEFSEFRKIYVDKLKNVMDFC